MRKWKDEIVEEVRAARGGLRRAIRLRSETHIRGFEEERRGRARIARKSQATETARITRMSCYFGDQQLRQPRVSGAKNMYLPLLLPGLAVTASTAACWPMILDPRRLDSR